MKKLGIITALLVIITALCVYVLNFGKGGSEVLYLLNWGEYINEDLLTQFEDEYGCIVVEETVTSSETMYQKISAGTTAYDVAIPGDYMITKLKNDGYLYELNTTDSSLENLYNYKNIFNDDLQEIRNESMPGLETYCMPYFWGAYSIIYNTQYSDTQSVILNNGFKAMFDRSLYNETVKIGMYNTARWCVAAYLMANGIDPNNEDFDTSKAVSDIKSVGFDVWGDDQLKRKTATGDLDMCFTQLGDFFDAVYLALEEGLDVNDSGKTGLDALAFNVTVPNTTSAFFDGLVIPTTSKNQKLANEFINFMLKPEVAYENALAIGYCPTLKSVIDLYNESAKAGEYYFEDEKNPERNILMSDFLAKYPMYLNPLVNSDNVTMFEPKESEYMTLCETIINQAKASVNTESNTGTIICFLFVGGVLIFIGTYTGVAIYKKRKYARNHK